MDRAILSPLHSSTWVPNLFISHKLDDLALARAAFKSAFIAFRVIWLDEHQKHPRAAFWALWMEN